VDANSIQHGFIFKNGIVQVIDADNSGTTVLEGLNNHEFTAGQVVDALGNQHAFTYNNVTGLFRMLNMNDGSSLQRAFGVNNGNLVAVNTSKDAGVTYASYIYCPKKANLCPNGGFYAADGPSWKMKPGASLHYDRNGRTGVHPDKLWPVDPLD